MWWHRGNPEAAGGGDGEGGQVKSEGAPRITDGVTTSDRAKEADSCLELQTWGHQGTGLAGDPSSPSSSLDTCSQGSVMRGWGLWHWGSTSAQRREGRLGTTAIQGQSHFKVWTTFQVCAQVPLAMSIGWWHLFCVNSLSGTLQYSIFSLL